MSEQFPEDKKNQTETELTKESWLTGLRRKFGRQAAGAGDSLSDLERQEANDRHWFSDDTYDYQLDRFAKNREIPSAHLAASLAADGEVLLVVYPSANVDSQAGVMLLNQTVESPDGDRVPSISAFTFNDYNSGEARVVRTEPLSYEGAFNKKDGTLDYDQRITLPKGTRLVRRRPNAGNPNYQPGIGSGEEDAAIKTIDKYLQAATTGQYVVDQQLVGRQGQ